MNNNLKSIIKATFAASALGAGVANAGLVAVLVGDAQIKLVDSEKGMVVGEASVTDMHGPILGIDVRPSNGQLYAVFADGVVATVDPMSGKAAKASELAMKLPEGVTATVDFNPKADRLRLMGNDGTNLRVNVDDGAVTQDGTLSFASGDMHAGETPNIVAGAYTNAVPAPETTALYDIDATIVALIKQDPPNDGVLNAVGKLGAGIDMGVGFDIQTDAQGRNWAWMMSGNTLYSVDLGTGAASEAGRIQGLSGMAIRDIAVLP